jgi:hypothetical protein
MEVTLWTPMASQDLELLGGMSTLKRRMLLPRRFERDSSYMYDHAQI